MSDNDEGPNLFNILLYMAAGGFITYLWLNKTKAQVKTTDIENLLYSQNNELLEHLKLLNETLLQRDKLLNEYQKSVQQQYQNIPTVIGSTINTELQQIALYLDAVNTQLEKISSQIKQILEIPNYQNQSRQQKDEKVLKSTYHNHQNDQNIHQNDQNDQHQNDQIIHQNIRNEPTQPIMSLENNSTPIYQKKYHSKTRNSDISNNLKNNDTKNIDDDKWSVKRGSDGRIKSLQNV